MARLGLAGGDRSDNQSRLGEKIYIRFSVVCFPSRVGSSRLAGVIANQEWVMNYLVTRLSSFDLKWVC